MVVILAFSGCTTFSDLSYETTQKLRAQKAWEQYDTGSCCYTIPYRHGWKAGYYDVLTGGSGCPPLFAPEKYSSPWKIIYHCDEPRHEWYVGYQDGAAAAKQEPDTHYLKPWLPPPPECQHCPVSLTESCPPTEYSDEWAGGHESSAPEMLILPGQPDANAEPAVEPSAEQPASQRPPMPTPAPSPVDTKELSPAPAAAPPAPASAPTVDAEPAPAPPTTTSLIPAAAPATAETAPVTGFSISAPKPIVPEAVPAAAEETFDVAVTLPVARLSLPESGGAKKVSAARPSHQKSASTGFMFTPIPLIPAREPSLAPARPIAVNFGAAASHQKVTRSASEPAAGGVNTTDNETSVQAEMAIAEFQAIR
ncbi:MAG: hypothetical protein KDA89_06020 [Planctomycetaceae bacterium]|nr:hypothetical protein [Planctomycetaceae bacterium]